MNENVYIIFEIGLILDQDHFSAGFEEEDGYLTEVEVNEVLSLMGDVRSKVSSYNSLQLGWELCNLGNLDKFIG